MKVSVNDAYLGAYKLTNKFLTLSSSIIKLEVMHCENWELKCPKHILEELRSTNPKGSHIRSKLRKFFNKF